MKQFRRWIGAVLTAFLSMTWHPAANAEAPCHTLAGGVDLCLLSHTSIDRRGDSDSIRVVSPSGPGPSEFGAYFPILPARSFAIGLDSYATEGVTGSWLEALARVRSGSVETAGAAVSPGSFSPLGTRVTHSAPKGKTVGTLTVLAELPKTAAPIVRLTIADHDSVVWRSGSRAAGAVAAVSDWPIGAGCHMLPMGGIEFSWRFERSAPIRILRVVGTRDSSVTGDELRIAGSGAPGMSLGQALVKASGMDSLRFSNPEIVHGTMPVSRFSRHPRRGPSSR